MTDITSARIKPELFKTSEVEHELNTITNKRVQEWLCLHNFKVVIDGDWGPATNRAVKSFCDLHLIPFRDYEMTGRLWNKLVYPMADALSLSIQAKTHKLSDVVSSVAFTHYSAKAREVGGNNRGPWVRIYMNGGEGVSNPWCAGFVSFVLEQAVCQNEGTIMPIAPSVSSSQLARNAKAQNRFVETIKNSKDMVIFVLKGGDTGYKHTGFGYDFDNDTFKTIEGNTNYEGSADGDTVSKRTRKTSSCDFILLN